MKAIPPQDVTLGQFTAAFVPWGLLVVGALLWPELTQSLDLNRTKATIWATTILLIPALTLYPFRSASTRTANPRTSTGPSPTSCFWCTPGGRSS